MRGSRVRPPGEGVGETSGKGRPGRLPYIDDVEASSTGFSARVVADAVGEPGLFVDYDVVGAGDSVVVGRFLERLGLDNVSELGQVEDLHPVVASPVCDDKGVVCVDLDVAVRTWGCPSGPKELAHIPGIGRITDIDERGPVAPAGQCVLASRHGVGPSPNVVHSHAPGAAEVLDWHVAN